MNKWVNEYGGEAKSYSIEKQWGVITFLLVSIRFYFTMDEAYGKSGKIIPQDDGVLTILSYFCNIH